MKDDTNAKIEKLQKKLGNYECDGQYNLFSEDYDLENDERPEGSFEEERQNGAFEEERL